jgi:eukaryotic-like serine/threonine-protein kinase
MIGETLGGKYTVERLLGEGGMGAVFEARHASTGRRVAVKVITGDIARNPKLVQRFEVEVKAAGRIESEHVVAVIDVGHDARGAPFLVMEHLAGGDLDELLARTGPLSPEAAVKIAMQACFGLAEAHRRGIVHRDVKPGNIFLCARDGGKTQVKLVDFGVAKLAEEAGGGAKLTRTGAILGSPLYMSPEQARTTGLDHRTDLWSLGVVLYEMLAGRPPYGDIEGLGELILLICTRPGPPLRSFAPWVDPALAQVVERALAIDAGQRFQTALEMAEALRSFSSGGSTELLTSMLVPARSGPVVMPAPVHVVTPLPEVRRASAQQAHAKTDAAEPLVPSPLAPPIDAPVLTPPPPPTGSAPRRSAVPFLAVAAVVAAGGVGGALALGKSDSAGAPSAQESVAVAPSLPPSASVPSAPGGPLAPLLGVWKSDSGRVYDAVLVGAVVELRLRDASQLAGQGYEDGEARFVLSAIPNEAATFNVEDRVRPLPPERTSYDLSVARPTCLVTWTEVAGKPLRATLEGDRLRMNLVVFKADKPNFVLRDNRVLRCEGLPRASVSETTSVLTRQ